MSLSPLGTEGLIPESWERVFGSAPRRSAVAERRRRAVNGHGGTWSTDTTVVDDATGAIGLVLFRNFTKISKIMSRYRLARPVELSASYLIPQFEDSRPPAVKHFFHNILQSGPFFSQNCRKLAFPDYLQLDTNHIDFL